MNDVLPDSRVKNPTDTKMVNWEFEEIEQTIENGLPVFRRVKRKYRLEMERVFCFNCGKTKGWIPRGIFSWVSMLCDPCSESVGEAAAKCNTSDHVFWDKVREEMVSRFGRGLTQQELNRLAMRDELGRLLELLNRESPLRGK